MPEYELRDNLDRLPKVIYFTDSFLALHMTAKVMLSIALCYSLQRKLSINFTFLLIETTFISFSPGCNSTFFHSKIAY